MRGSLSRRWLMQKRANTDAKARTSARVRAVARPATTVAKARTPAKAKGAAAPREAHRPALHRQALQLQAEISASEHLTHTRFISRKVGFSRRCLRVPARRSVHSGLALGPRRPTALLATQTDIAAYGYGSSKTVAGIGQSGGSTATTNEPRSMPAEASGARRRSRPSRFRQSLAASAYPAKAVHQRSACSEKSRKGSGCGVLGENMSVAYPATRRHLARTLLTLVSFLPHRS